ncbi:MAG: hypothetical protein US75_C0003G0011 [Candidatus Woesebacteria bacterium GW2011_GWC1_38_13]|uniref:Uncharacterized protein n=3 Tax=Candidatus Woeseibacteriota TaxID=1752722 RepID=A0A0G0ND32_9BACT|nr:MAG: hypothetical protein US67_C0021G0003 [Candidatus Woesebacteria bacterium GW2011_GWD1_38_10]KKQ56724.1 MAG: hypothetical protein US75_C0003G0011 [Candidatus Woesebacteria bacterium GW2011_GWC1_38_13]KKQ83794.1 MAG: hypothetical protein UT06_C0016G0015 [Candidatus Woesebacteria bacterium GW2011_GWA1_38_8]
MTERKNEIHPRVVLKEAENKARRSIDSRKTASALRNLTPLVYEVLAENLGGVDTQGYQVEIEEGLTQQRPGEDREETYRDACSTLRSQGKSMQDIANALLRDPEVLTALSLGEMTRTQYEGVRGIFIDSLSEYYPGAKKLKDKTKKT